METTEEKFSRGKTRRRKQGPTKIFQRKDQKEETRSNNIEETPQRAQPFGPILRSKPLTQIQQTKKPASLGKKKTTVPVQDQPVPTLSHLCNWIARLLPPTMRQHEESNEEFLHTIDRTVDATQGHSKDHGNVWTIQVLQELLSGGTQLSVLQNIYNPIMGTEGLHHRVPPHIVGTAQL
jgi:hypothetical protein